MTDSTQPLTPGPKERVQCVTCKRWPMVQNWPNHMLGQGGPHWPASRAARTADPGGLDVERLARALHRNAIHNDKHPDYRGCSTCDPVAANLAAEYAALTPETTAPDLPGRYRRGEYGPET